MHEWALAEAIIKTAIEIAEKEGLKETTDINVKIGELQQVERPVLRFALSQLKPASLQNAKFHIGKAKTILKCRVCGNTWLFKKETFDEETAESIHFIPELAHTYIKCPNCGSPDFEITQGRGIWLASIKGEK